MTQAKIKGFGKLTATAAPAPTKKLSTNAQAALNYVKNNLGYPNPVIVEERLDPMVNYSSLVRYKDSPDANTAKDFLLVNDGVVIDECVLEKGMETLKDIKELGYAAYKF